MNRSTFSQNSANVKIKRWQSIVALRLVQAAVLLILAMGLITKHVHAADTTGIIPSQFDYIYYADAYPDLKAAFGYNAEALLNHYILFGQAEGRLCYAGDPGNEARMALIADFYKVGSGARIALNEDQLTALCLAEAGVTAGMDPLTISTKINDYLCSIASYDYTYKYHDSDTLLKYGTGVCQAYALAYKRLMNAAGVPTDYVYGNAWNRRQWGLHAWNRFQYNGVWYYVDVCWNDGLSSHRYLNVSESEISPDHILQGLNRSGYR